VVTEDTIVMMEVESRGSPGRPRLAVLLDVLDGVVISDGECASVT
jgi:hypothetical protein